MDVYIALPAHEELGNKKVISSGVFTKALVLTIVITGKKMTKAI